MTGDGAGAAGIAELQAAYGAPSQAAFGSAVFSETLAAGDDLEQKAQAWYRHFLGDRWDAMGETAWMDPWAEVVARPSRSGGDIVAELRAIPDPQIGSAAGMVLDAVEDADRARAVLVAVFDDPAITELRAYALGDGGAMSGVEIAARRDDGHGIFLVFLMD